jgi:arginine metabolism regulation protein II
LIDAEHLLRLRGLAKRDLSRRARLLHHVYTWIRIIGESTFTLHDYKSSLLRANVESGINRDRQNSAAVSRQDRNTALADQSSQLDDFLRVETQGTDSDSDPEATKDQEQGLRDIHLEVNLQWPKTLYMQIYGIPEIWLGYVSQTTRLANAMEILDQSPKDVSRAFRASLQRKIDRLEHMICAFDAEHSVSPPTSPSQFAGVQSETAAADSSSTASGAMLCAMSSSLVIFFYRRIRKVHPWILHGHVKNVISALKTFDVAEVQGESKVPGTPWPAFIAGCEAVSTSDRNYLEQWLQKRSKNCPLSGFTSAQQVMHEVWARRDALNKSTTRGAESSNQQRSHSSKTVESCSWPEVLKSTNNWLMLF